VRTFRQVIRLGRELSATKRVVSRVALTLTRLEDRHGDEERVLRVRPGSQSAEPAPAPHASATSMGIAAFSTVVEWYDFTLYLYFASVMARIFFGGGEMALASTLGGFAVAYLMRPIGAMVLGHYGDRLGRRRMMMLSMGLMTAAMFATALLPTHEQVGAASGVLLVLLRCLMAFSVGAEYTGVVAYLLEGSKPDRRGLIASLAAASSEVGGLLAVGVSTLTVLLLSPEALAAWGWRIPFLIGGALAGLVWAARSFITETPAFERQLQKGAVWKSPLKRMLVEQRAAIARGFAISALGSVTYYVGITYVPTFLVSVRAMSEADALRLATIAGVAVILVTPVFGLLSDRYGRKPILQLLCASSVIVPVAMFHLMGQGSLLHITVGALALAALGGGVSAVGAVTTAEQLPMEGRMSGLALGATTATAIFGGLVPYLSQLLLEWLKWPPIPGVMIAIVGAAIWPVLWAMPETRPRSPNP
jgi:MHS family proline/betaine transporter-like MFS transporter